MGNNPQHICHGCGRIHRGMDDLCCFCVHGSRSRKAEFAEKDYEFRLDKAQRKMAWSPVATCDSAVSIRAKEADRPSKRTPAILRRCERCGTPKEPVRFKLRSRICRACENIARDELQEEKRKKKLDEYYLRRERKRLLFEARLRCKREKERK